MNLNKSVTIIIIAIAIIVGWYYFSQNQKGKPDEISQSMDKFLKRPIHKNLTKGIIDSINDNDLEQAIFDNISQIIAASKKDELRTVEGLSPGQKALYSTWLVEAEVNNGGFNQFYFNSSNQFSKMAVDSFKLVGATKFAELMQRANTTYESIKDNLEKFNDGTIESFSKSYDNNPLNKLDDKFYKLYKEENLSQLKIKYIRSHLEEFTQN